MRTSAPRRGPRAKPLRPGLLLLCATACVHATLPEAPDPTIDDVRAALSQFEPGTLQEVGEPELGHIRQTVLENGQSFLVRLAVVPVTVSLTCLKATVVETPEQLTGHMGEAGFTFEDSVHGLQRQRLLGAGPCAEGERRVVHPLLVFERAGDHWRLRAVDEHVPF